MFVRGNHIIDLKSQDSPLLYPHWSKVKENYDCSVFTMDYSFSVNKRFLYRPPLHIVHISQICTTQISSPWLIYGWKICLMFVRKHRYIKSKVHSHYHICRITETFCLGIILSLRVCPPDTFVYWFFYSPPEHWVRICATYWRRKIICLL